jgi:hypothetical protein
MALGPHGEAVVSSNIVPTLWRIDPDTFTVTKHPLVLDADADKDIGFAGVVYSAEHQAFFAVSDVHGSLWNIDSVLRRARRIALSEPVRGACVLTERARAAERPASRLAALCVATAERAWTIELAPDKRSAYRRPVPCNDA